VLGSSVFDRLRASLGPDAFARLCEEKIHAIAGDLTREHMGLSADEYAELAATITRVVNSAATVTFDERLDLALDLNTFGPGRLLAIAKDAGHVPFLHVSTCYVCGVRRGRVAEELSAPEKALASLPRCSNGDDFDLDAIVTTLRARCAEIATQFPGKGEQYRRQLIEAGMTYAREHGWSDTYTFTKWLGERYLDRDRGRVPLAIHRPAIIESSYEEPAPGWIDGLRMADPMIVAYGRGKLREFPADGTVPLDLIPVDFVANSMLAVLAYGMSDPASLPVYQCASSDRNTLLVGEMTALTREAFRCRPMIDEHGRAIDVRPLELVDVETFSARWGRRKRRVELLKKVYNAVGGRGRFGRRLSTARRNIAQLLYFAKIYSPYTHLDCTFSTDRTRELWDRLSPDDRKEFPFDEEQIDWEDYLVDRHVPGLRSYVLGTGAEPSARLREAGTGALTDEAPHDALQGSSLFELFERTAATFGSKPALQIRRGDKWIRYTYAELLRATGSVMKRFCERGLVPGDRVALSGENGPEWGLAYLAIMRAGLTAVPLDPQLPVSDTWAAARFADCNLLCAGRSMFDALQAGRSQQDPPIVKLAEPFVPPPAASRDPGPEPIPLTGTEIASILFTSGTTVAPKAVKLTHRNLMANARALLERHPVEPADEFLSVLPLYHAFEFTGGFLVPLACGATITYVERLKGPEIMAALCATGTTLMLVVPRLLRMFHDGICKGVAARGPLGRFGFALLGHLSNLTGHRYGRRLFGSVHKKFGGRLRMFVSGGSKLDPELLPAFERWGFGVCEGYGLTETSPVITVNPPDDARKGSVGPPLSNLEVEVRNQNLEGIGEIWVRGPSITSGYLYNEAATNEILVDGWLRTGDLGRQDESAYLYLTGRIKDLIITSAGKNVYPDEVEFRHRSLPFTKELCVLAMPAEDSVGDEVHAVVVIDSQQAPAELDRSSLEREIHAAAAEISDSMPSHQRITTFHFWDRELPKTSTLKAKRSVIRDMLLSRGMSATSPQAGSLVSSGAPITVENAEALKCIQAIVARVGSGSRAADVTPNAHLLLDLGLDSIAKLEVIADVEARFRMKIDDKTTEEIARVSDLLNVVGARTPSESSRRDRSAAGRRLLGNGRLLTADRELSAPLLPVRWALRGGAMVFMNSYVRVKVRGREHIPSTGPVLLAPNHSSHLDSPAVVCAVGGKRRIWVAGAADYFFDTAIKRFLFGRVFDTIPFDRHADGVQGLRRCAQALHRGDGLLLFPEGTRSISGEIQPFKIGTAVLATEAGIPVVPVHIARTWELFRKGRRFVRPGVVHVTFGEPIRPPSAEELEEDRFAAYRSMTTRIEQRVKRLAKDYARR
ncbi:MAG: AMP-binding protein, partial [Planctomycetes bacterium]|nr:AMP-binding protein [Planctomycetota bacterium]